MTAPTRTYDSCEVHRWVYDPQDPFDWTKLSNKHECPYCHLAWFNYYTRVIKMEDM